MLKVNLLLDGLREDSLGRPVPLSLWLPGLATILGDETEEGGVRVEREGTTSSTEDIEFDVECCVVEMSGRETGGDENQERFACVVDGGMVCGEDVGKDTSE